MILAWASPFKLIGLWCNYYQYIPCFMVFLGSLIFVYNIHFEAIRLKNVMEFGW